MTFIPPLPSIVSDANSTTTPLGAGVTFTGTGVEALLYSTVSVTVFVDQQGIVHVDQSTDNVNWDFASCFVVPVSQAVCHIVDICAQYVRTRFENTASNPQTTFRLQTLLNPSGLSPETVTTTNIGFDTVVKDAFGRLRVSSPTSIIDAKFIDTQGLNEYSGLTSGSGTITFTAGRPQLVMEVDGNVAGRAVRQSRRYATYQPGKSLLFFLSGTFITNNGVEGITSRIGIFDDKADKTVDTVKTGDGFFFSYASGASPVIDLVYRTSNNATFTQIDTIVTQSNWNTDSLDGSGPSGQIIDPTKRNIMWLSQEWLGSGVVQVGFVINADLVLAHQFNFANNAGIEDTVAYTSTSSLPIRYEVISAGTGAATTVQMQQICATAIVEGDFNPKGRVFSADRGQTALPSTTTELPMMSLRLRASQNRHLINPLDISVINEDNTKTVVIRVYRFISPSSSPLTGAVWVNSGTDGGLFESAAEYDVTATAVSFAGTHEHVWGGYLRPGSDINLGQITNRFLLDADIAGNSDIAVFTSQTVTGSAPVLCAINWQEYS